MLSSEGHGGGRVWKSDVLDDGHVGGEEDPLEVELLVQGLGQLKDVVVAFGLLPDPTGSGGRSVIELEFRRSPMLVHEGTRWTTSFDERCASAALSAP